MTDITIPGLGSITKLNTDSLLVVHDMVTGSDKNMLWSDYVASYEMTQPMNWYAQLAKIKQGISGEQAVLAVVGDSWVQNSYIIYPLRAALQTAYGDAGMGYVGIGNDHGSPGPGVGYSYFGTWVNKDNIDVPTPPGLDIASKNSSDTTTPGKITIFGPCNTMVIHYFKQSGGGDFRYRIDSGSWTTVSTANASDLYSTVTISGLSTATHTIDIEVLTAGTSGVTLMGVDLQKTGNGVRVQRLGNGGATAQQYASAIAQVWQDGWTALAPHAVCILLGTNDHSNNVLPATFGGQIETMITRINTALPLTDVILFAPADNGLTGKTYAVSQYKNELRNVAIRKNCTFIDTYSVIGGYTNGNARGMYSNTSHLSAIGGQAFADAVVRRIREQ